MAEVVSPVSATVAALTVRGLVPETPPTPLDLVDLVNEVVPVVASQSGLDVGHSSLSFANLSRRSWAERNARSYAALLERLYPEGVPAGAAELSGALLGAVLAALCPRVLGQYLPGGPDEEPLLVLVGQNVARLAEAAGAPYDVVARWVLAHELTHRAQFYSAPWLLELLYGAMAEILRARPATPVDALMALLRSLGDDQRRGEFGPLELVLPERAAEALAKVSAVMSVVEGHADWVMRTLPAGVVPGDDDLARVVDQRRRARGLARLVARILGFDQKVRQYERGRAFFEAIEREDPGASREVFADPASLPTLDELDDPTRWLARVRAASA